MSATPHRRSRRRAALLGVVAILLQALLFGWHHHPLPANAAGVQPAPIAAAAPLLPGAADDDCDICQALHHLNAAPADFAAVAAPAVAATALPLPARILAGTSSHRPFQARAPPPA